jgi:hypothetical protein
MSRIRGCRTHYAGVNGSPSKKSRSRALALSGCRDENRKKRTRPIFLSTRVGFNSEMDTGPTGYASAPLSVSSLPFRPALHGVGAAEQCAGGVCLCAVRLARFWY